MSVNLSETTRPVSDYREALARIEQLQTRDADRVVPSARTRFLGQGQKAPRTIILLHSLTGSPGQFELLGHQFHQRGYNVLMPRMPHHGYADRLTNDQANLSTDDLLNYLNEAIDVGQGLGNHVTVAGLGVGGTLAALAAQLRGDVDQTLLINAVFAVKGILGGLSGFASSLPNQFLWWKPLAGANFGPEYMYPRYSTRAAARMFDVAKTVQQTAAQMRPTARRVVAVLNDSDPLVDHGATQKLLRVWQERGARQLVEHHFEGLPAVHEIVDPNLNPGHADEVCSVIVELASV
jgi:pimeloyl-ACP methyl ester carboxylesterase